MNEYIYILDATKILKIEFYFSDKLLLVYIQNTSKSIYMLITSKYHDY